MHEFRMSNDTANTVRSIGRSWIISIFFKNPLKKINTKVSSGRFREKRIRAIVKRIPIELPNRIPAHKINKQMKRFSFSWDIKFRERRRENFLCIFYAGV